MGQILLRWKVPLAALLALAFIVSAYILAQGIRYPGLAKASPETELLNAIASRDSDSDGLPDWEEALYGTSPNNADTNKLGMTDGEAVQYGLIVPKAFADVPVATSSPSAAAFIDPELGPVPGDNTLTAAFSRQFLTAYLAAKQGKGGADLSQDDINAIANQVLSSLSESVVAAPNFKTAEDLTVSGSGPDVLKAFAVGAETVLLKNTSTATTSELSYLANVLQSGDAASISHIVSLAKAYRAAALGLAVLPVPQELAAAHLSLVNALMRTGDIVADFARVHTDPLATMLALYQYPRATVSLALAFVEIGRVYHAAGVALPAKTPGASFVNIVSNAITNIEGAASNTP